MDRDERWQFRVGRGGTFTGVIGRSPDGQRRATKVLSNHPTLQEDAVVAGIRQLFDAATDTDVSHDAGAWERHRDEVDLAGVHLAIPMLPVETAAACCPTQGEGRRRPPSHRSGWTFLRPPGLMCPRGAPAPADSGLGIAGGGSAAGHTRPIRGPVAKRRRAAAPRPVTSSSPVRGDGQILRSNSRNCFLASSRAMP